MRGREKEREQEEGSEGKKAGVHSREERKKIM
jgi:hypothetical protein